MTSRPAAAATWPVYLWLSQLAVPLAAVAYAARRLAVGRPPGPVLTLAAALGLLWAAAAIGAVCLPGGRRWIGARKWEILISFVSLGLTFLLVDLALTLTGTIPTIGAVRVRSLEYRSSISTRHRLVPKTVESASAAPLRIGARGLKGDEPAATPTAGRDRLLFLGGSQVFDFDHDWPGQVERLLRDRGHDVEILNAAVPGHTTGDSLGKLITDLWLLEPDLIFVCNAWNDIKYFSSLSKEVPYRDFVRPFRGDWRIEPKGLDRLLSLSAIYRRFRNKIVREMFGEEGRRPRPATNRIGEAGPDQYRLNLRALAHVTHDLGAVPVFCRQARLPARSSLEDDRRRIAYGSVGLDHDRLVEAFALTDRIVEEVAESSQAHVVDMSQALSGRSDLFRDHVHFTSDGSREASLYVAEWLDDFLLTSRSEALR